LLQLLFTATSASVALLPVLLLLPLLRIIIIPRGPVIIAEVPALATVLQLFEPEEFKALHLRFGSGVSVRELQSIATLIAQFAQIPGPSRSEKRNGIQLAKWYKRSWETVSEWLPLVELRDGNDRPIDGAREVFEKHLYKPNFL
jgi:hypothetical protein